jgi:hypothetical protein
VTPEIVVGLIAVFISGGALGAAGTLLGQWVLKKIGSESPERVLGSGDLDLLRGDLADLARKLQQVDVRLDFTEQLLGGALPLSRPVLTPDPVPDSDGGDPDPDSDA